MQVFTAPSKRRTIDVRTTQWEKYLSHYDVVQFRKNKEIEFGEHYLKPSHSERGWFTIRCTSATRARPTIK
jgi:hypothetical protein